MKPTREEVERLTDAELQSFYEYAGANMTEPDGSQCQWADYSTRCVEEIRKLRNENEKLKEQLLHESYNLNKAGRKELKRLQRENEELKDGLMALATGNQPAAVYGVLVELEALAALEKKMIGHPKMDSELVEVHKWSDRLYIKRIENLKAKIKRQEAALEEIWTSHQIMCETGNCLCAPMYGRVCNIGEALAALKPEGGGE